VIFSLSYERINKWSPHPSQEYLYYVPNVSHMLRYHYKPSGILDRFAKFWYVSIYFFNYIPYKCHKNPSSDSRDIPH